MMKALVVWQFFFLSPYYHYPLLELIEFNYTNICPKRELVLGKRGGFKTNVLESGEAFQWGFNCTRTEGLKYLQLNSIFLLLRCVIFGEKLTLHE